MKRGGWKVVEGVVGSKLHNKNTRSLQMKLISSYISRNVISSK